MAEETGDGMLTKGELERALREVSAERDSLRSKLQEEVERHRRIAEDDRWHPEIRSQRQLFINRLEALLDDQPEQEGGK